MKKFYFECSICPILKDNIVRYITNTKKIFTPDFVKQNYHKHFGYSLFQSLSILSKLIGLLESIIS